MERVHQVLRDADPQVVEEISEMLFGDAAEEIVKSLLVSKSTQQQRERTQARVGLASNIVGLGAGAAGTYEAANKLKSVKTGVESAGPIGRMAGSARLSRGALKPIGGAAKMVMRHPGKTAAAGLGLQVANVAGDAVANRVLSRSAKVKKSVGKSQEFTIRTEIAKTDDDKRLVFGWASIVKKDGRPVVDLQGDYIDADTIEKAAYDYVVKSRQGGYEHHRDGDKAKHVSDMVESIVITDEKKRALGLPEDFPEGWWTGYRVNDDDVWADVKSGKVTGFSVHGSGLKKDYEVSA